MGKTSPGRSHFAPPAGRLEATLTDWGGNRLVHRVHPAAYDADVFNPSDAGDARFSPIRRADGSIIPTLYAGENQDCALMETVFHDVPYAPGFKPMLKLKFENKLHSEIIIEPPLKLIDLKSIALRKLGIERKYLIDSLKAHYPESRQWALLLYDQNPDAQGLLWTSRQHDGAEAIMLFEDRVPAGALKPQGPSQSLIVGGYLIPPVIALADRIGVTIVS